MSRWSWHPKKGTRHGVVSRHSDEMTPEQEEKLERERHQREQDWIEHHPRNEPVFQITRICNSCGDTQLQIDMHWIDSTYTWMCPTCHH